MRVASRLSLRGYIELLYMYGNIGKPSSDFEFDSRLQTSAISIFRSALKERSRCKAAQQYHPLNTNFERLVKGGREGRIGLGAVIPHKAKREPKPP